VFRTAYKQGRREPNEAYAADALVALVTGKANGKPAAPQVVIDVTHRSLVTGEVGERDVCEVRGVGPIPVGRAREIMADAFLKALLTDGQDVRLVKHFGRHLPAEIRTALAWRYRTCIEPGCDRTVGLEWDHVDPVANGGPTSYENVGPRCKLHHKAKTERDRAVGLLGGERGPP
jgi:hypothetical protein